MPNTIVIFTLDNCIHCTSLKKRLKKEKIPYVDIDIDSNQNIWNQVINQTGHNVVPSVFVKSDDIEEGPIYVPGKDFEDENTIVEIIKTHFN